MRLTLRVRMLAAAVTATSALVAPFAAGHQEPGATSAASPAQPPQLVASRALPRVRGQVGPGETISVTPSRVVKGRYRVVVKDESSTHNWHLSGPGDVDRKTSVEGTGRWVWRLRLRRGTYAIVCDVHTTTMSTSLRVTAG